MRSRVLLTATAVLAALGAALTAPVSAQQTIVVAAGGGGQFTDIPPAIAAARSGDTILVRAGTYSPFTLDKGLRVLADPGAVAGHILLSYRVQGVPAGQVAVIRNLEPNPVPVSARIVVQDNEGVVHIENVRAASGISIVRSRQVSLLKVVASGGLPSAVTVQDSTVVASECAFTGLVSLSFASGLECVRSNVIFVQGSLQGSQGSTRSSAGPGARVLGGKLTIAGDANTRIAAGTGGLGPSSAITSAKGQIVVDPAVTLVPTGALPPISGTGFVTTRTVPALTASTTARVLTAKLHAPGAQTAFLVASPALNPPVSLPFGELWVGITHVLLDAGPVSPGGTRTATIALPRLAAGTVAAMQWAVVGPGTFELSTPGVPTLDG